MADPDPLAARDEIDTLRVIVEGTARHTGEEFFRALVRNLSRATGVPNAFVAEFAGSGTRVRTLALWRAGAFAPNAEWDVPGTPCEDVLRGDVCHHPTGVAEKFPNDPGVESYLGVPLREAGGAVLGRLAVYDARPMPAEPRLLDTFNIFAARAAAELDRLRMDRMLRDSEARYRDLFDEAPVAYVAVDAVGCLTRANRATADLLGRPADALAGTCLVGYAPLTAAGRGWRRCWPSTWPAGRSSAGRSSSPARPAPRSGWPRGCGRSPARTAGRPAAGSSAPTSPPGCWPSGTGRGCGSITSTCGTS